MRKKVFVRTYGCQMNVRDSEVIAGLLRAEGYQLTDNPDEAGVVIFNTCSVRQHAEDRVWSLIGSYKGAKIIGLAGCMAQNYKEKAFARNADVDFVVGPADIDKIPDILKRLMRLKNEIVQPIATPSLRLLRRVAPRNDKMLERKIQETDGEKRPEEVYHTGYYQDKHHAHIVISEGCSNFCSYCVVPYVRGPLRHRKQEDILTEIQEAIARRITKITLLGQNVNAYQDGQVNFTKLLIAINALNGLKEFDFFTAHPKDAGVDLFKAMRDLEKLVKRLHLPLQSGSDKILKLMNRGYTVKDYLALIDSYRKIVKGGRLTTDIIVGFPTETDAEFKQTCALVNQVRFNAAYIFKYSSRPGTQAAKITDELKPGELEKRHEKMLNLQRGISKKLRSG